MLLKLRLIRTPAVKLLFFTSIGTGSGPAVVPADRTGLQARHLEEVGPEIRGAQEGRAGCHAAGEICRRERVEGVAEAAARRGAAKRNLGARIITSGRHDGPEVNQAEGARR